MKQPKKPSAVAHAVEQTPVHYASAPVARRVSSPITDALFARLVKHAPGSGNEAILAIRSGYPASILKSAGYYFGIPDARIQRITAVPATTAQRLEKNAANIDPAASERIHRMGIVTRIAIEVFDNKQTALSWMCRSNPALADSAPLDLLDTEPGAIAVRQILNAIATGGVV